MPKNNLFRYTDGSNSNEINILKSVNQEFIQIAGQEARYFPKQILISNDIFGEDIYKFDKYYTFPVRFEQPSDIFNTKEDIFDIHGFEGLRDLTIFVSILEYEEALGFDYDTYGPPRIGDVFYFDFLKQLYQITYINDEDPAFAFGEKILYKIKAKKYEHQNDEFDITEDNILDTDLKSIISINEEKSDNIKEDFQEFVDNYSILVDGGTPWGEI